MTTVDHRIGSSAPLSKKLTLIMPSIHTSMFYSILLRLVGRLILKFT